MYNLYFSIHFESKYCDIQLWIISVDVFYNLYFIPTTLYGDPNLHIHYVTGGEILCLILFTMNAIYILALYIQLKH